MSIEDLLRRLPKVDQLLSRPEWQELIERFGRWQVVAWTRTAVAHVRQQIRDHAADSRTADLVAEVLSVLQHLAEDESAATMQRVINATGVILHTNLGRAPLADAAIARVREVAGATNLELDLRTGKRGRRGDRARQLLKQLTGAEDAVVVNNCAAATLLTLHVLARGREVILSRGQLVEIGGKFRLPEVFESAGVRLREVGTTNRTYLEDYQNAVGEQTAAVMRVHRSNFAQTGFVAEPSIEELRAKLQLPPGVALIDDCGSGLVHRIPDILPREPVIQESVAAGADLVLFSGDKLFGGPQAGIIVGRREWTRQLQQHPWMRTLRTDKLTLAALEATTELHLRNDLQQIPVYRMLLASEQDLQQRARRLHELITTSIPVGLGNVEVRVVRSESAIGGGSAPDKRLSSHAVAIQSDHHERLAETLRTERPAVVARCEEGAVVLDVRTIDPRELEVTGQCVADAVARVVGGEYQ